VYDIRWIDLDGLVNLRDVGGMPTVDGGVIVAGRLLRSDNLQELTPDSLDRLTGELGVTDVIDLRSHVERAREGASPVLGRSGVQVHELTLYADDAAEGGLPAEEHELPWVVQARRLRQQPTDRPRIVPTGTGHDAFWSRHYLGYLQERPDSVVAAVRAIAHARGAALVHCAAGKDRTGTITGLALVVAGAQREAVMADYAATADRIDRILERLARRPAYAENLRGKTKAEQSPRAETMGRLLDTLDRDHGGALGWLHEHGWQDEDTVLLRAKLREG
jgi:protein-tyrosine phosphatase